VFESPAHHFVSCSDGGSHYKAGGFVAAFEGGSVSGVEKSGAFLAEFFDESDIFVVVEEKNLFSWCRASLDRLD
jgi:hypothetical protein